MASTIEWPLSLPQLYDVEFDTPDTRIKSETDVGPMKVRRRYSFVPKTLSGKLALTAQQAAELDTFYDVSLEAGTLTFNWEHPITDVRYEMLFKTKGKYQQFKGGIPRDRVWICVVEFEVRNAA